MRREPVVPDQRKPPSPARMERVWRRENGICWWCGRPVAMRGPTVRYDHRLALDLGGPETDENLFPLHRDPCDLAKTAEDATAIAKARRLRKSHDPDREKKPSRFPPGRQLQGQGFDKTRSRGFDGHVRRR